jgi:hypothetical protein
MLAALLAAAALLAWVPTPGRAGSEREPGDPPPATAQYRGCDSAGWCRFHIEAPHPLAGWDVRVHPDGVPLPQAGSPTGIELRDRLNALLASMIHQNKRILLTDLRVLGEGRFAASVVVDGLQLATDPFLMEIGRRVGASSRVGPPSD